MRNKTARGIIVHVYVMRREACGCMNKLLFWREMMTADSRQQVV